MTIIPETNKDPVEVSVKSQQEKEMTLLGRYRKIINGGKIFRYCKSSDKMFIAKFIQEDTITLGDNPNKSRLHVEKNSIYIEALNEKNAWKRLKKGKIIFTS